MERPCPEHALAQIGDVQTPTPQKINDIPFEPLVLQAPDDRTCAEKAHINPYYDVYLMLEEYADQLQLCCFERFHFV